MTALLTSILLLFQAIGQDLPLGFPREGSTLALENDRVNIWDATWPKNKPSVLHRHIYDLVGIDLVDATVSVTSQGGSPRSVSFKKGNVLFLRKGTVHMEEGLSDIPRHAILIDLKDAPSPGYENKTTYPNAFPRDGATKLLENSRIVLWDYTWTPGQPVPMHFHDKDVVIVFFEEGELKSTAADGQVQLVPMSPGAFRFSPGNRAHSEELTKGKGRAIIVELK